MPYPPRPRLPPRAEFAGTVRTGTRAAGDVQERLETVVITRYCAGWSPGEIVELVDRSQTAVRGVLDEHGVPRRPVAATALHRVDEDSSWTSSSTGRKGTSSPKQAGPKTASASGVRMRSGVEMATTVTRWP